MKLHGPKSQRGISFIGLLFLGVVLALLAIVGARVVPTASEFMSIQKAVKKAAADGDRRRVAQEAAYRFMQAMAGNEAGYEEAARALFAGDIGSFEQHSAAWPDDVREHAALLAADAFAH